MHRMPLRIHLTGRVALSVGDATVDEAALAGRLGRLVLVRLALYPHPVDRDRLVEDLWPEGAPPGVESVLNATFSRLRSSFNELGIDGRAVLISSGGVAELRPPVGTRIDVVSTTQAIDTAEGAIRRDDLAASWAAAVVAHSIARRPLLPGVERLWLDTERDRLEQVLVRSLAVLCDVWLDRGDGHQAVTMARELVRHDRFAEGAHRRLVTALLALDDRSAAARAVAQWEAMVTDELGLAADDRLRSLLPSGAPH